MNLGIISTNQNKYSETFIAQQINRLPFDIFLYSNGYLPNKISLDKGQSFKGLSTENINENSNEEKLIQSFKNQKIEAVLAQYGQSGVELMPICKKLNIPLFVHFHGFDAFRNDALNSYGIHYKELFAFAKAIIAVSRDMANQLEKLGCPKDKLHLIPYGVDSEFFKPAASSERKDFISCARFVEKKGHSYTLKAFMEFNKIHPDVKLNLIGDGPLKAQIEYFVQENNLDEIVQFLGILSPLEVKYQLQTSIGLIQHSIKSSDNDSEGTPVSIMEAMACELPIITTKHAGIKDLVVHNKNGFLLEEKDIKSTTEKMLQLFENEPLRIKMGSSGRKRIIESYTVSRYISELTQLITS